MYREGMRKKRNPILRHIHVERMKKEVAKITGEHVHARISNDPAFRYRPLNVTARSNPFSPNIYP